MFSSEHNSVFNDLFAAAFSFFIYTSVLAFLGKIYKKGLIDAHLIRKLGHISNGLIVMLCWPMFSSGMRGAVLAGLVPGLCSARPLMVGFGIRKDERLVKLLSSRFKDRRDLLKATLSYVCTIALATVFYWRSPLGIAIISNLCAGDGVADIAGRRFGSWKLPYNENKSLAGSIGMAIAGFLASIGFMFYFCWLGYIEENSNMVVGFLIVSIASTLVESHPLSTKLDDNFTVPLASLLLGIFLL